MMGEWMAWAEAARTSTGFFWKAVWAFVLGYAVSAMIQTFVPKKKLTRYMGQANLRSLSLSTAFGAISSSCSFAALATARSLLQKGAHFAAAVAFMFASTNLVIELGILIFIFLGWPFLAAEIVGGLILILISTLLIKWTFPSSWIKAARRKVEEKGEDEMEDFDWRQRIRSPEGWRLVGHHFVMEWQMVWKEILIGFTIAGMMAAWVPASFWETIFLGGQLENGNPSFLVVLENAMVAPLVAAATFIGSMGNIPLATVLSGSGVLFAGIMGFIYSDLMVPPLVQVNAKYYGWRVALYIAGIMYVSIVATALLLHYGFLMIGITPESNRALTDTARFQLDYTFYLNLLFAAVAGLLFRWHRLHQNNMKSSSDHAHDHEGGVSTWLTPKNVAVALCLIILAGGWALAIFGS